MARAHLGPSRNLVTPETIAMRVVEATSNTTLNCEAPRPAPVFRIVPGARSFVPEGEEANLATEPGGSES
jgi:hypothetical protein